MKDNNVILEVKDLHKSFGEQEVLKGISTEVNRGDVIASSDRQAVESLHFYAPSICSRHLHQDKSFLKEQT